MIKRPGRSDGVVPAARSTGAPRRRGIAAGGPLAAHTSQRILAMIDLHYWTTPNGHKVTMALEEMGLAYKITPVRIGAGDQFKPEFLRIAPNNRIPAIIDDDPPGGGAPVSIFE